VAARPADGVPLEEIPQARDFVEYEFLDQSIIVLRTDDMGVVAFQNACRHRGVKLVEGRGTCERAFTCTYHGWCYGLDGRNTAVTRRRTFAGHNLQPDDPDFTPVQCEGLPRRCRSARPGRRPDR
jgi:Rieske 2Fe-2S family protein